MADYREISQDYAQGAIRAALLINGGAAVAVLSQLNSLTGLMNTKSVASALLVFCFGILFAAATWIFAFLSTRHVDIAELGHDKDYSKANNFMSAGVVSIVLSLLAFIIGVLILVCSL